MSKKGENIYKRKDGRWEGRYIKFYDENGKAKYGYVYSKSYKETKNKLLEVKVDIYGEKNIGNAKIVYYGKILEERLELTKINVKESTYTRYKHIVYKHICPDLGKYQLNKISTQLVERFIENKLKFGRLDNKGGLSIKTTSDILMVVKSSIEYAKYHDYSVNCNLDRITIKKKNKEMRVLNLKEQTLLTNYLLQETDLCKFGVMLSLYTGIRVGELCALKWKNFCFESKKLIIQETMIRIQNNSNVVEPKTKVIIT